MNMMTIVYADLKNPFEQRPDWIAMSCVMVLLFVGCATGPTLRAVDAKLMSRNFLHGDQQVNVEPNIEQPGIPYRHMRDFQTEKTGEGAGSFLWKVRVRVVRGAYKGNHTVYVHPEKQQIVDWEHEK